MTAVDDAPAVGPPEEVPLGRNRDFQLLWIGAGVMMLGHRVIVMAYPLLVLWASGSPSSAGLVGLMAMLPYLVVQLPAGALVDRWDRRRVMITTDVAGLLLGAGVTALVLTGHMWLPALMTLAFLQTTLAVLYQLAERAGMPQLVPDSQLSAALTRNEARTRGAALIGQPIGSVLFSLVAWVPFLVGTVAHVVSLVSVLGIRGRLQSDQAPPAGKLWHDIREGIAWMWGQHFLRVVMLLIAVSNAVFQAQTIALMVIFRDDGRSAALVGIVAACAGIGGMFGALSGGWWIQRLMMRDIVIGGLLVWTVLVPPLAFTGQPWVLGVLFALSGYVGGVFNVAGAAYVVRVAPDRIRGRANSLAMLVGSAGLAVGPPVGGLALDAYGVTPTILGLAAAMALLVVMAVLSRSVRTAGPADPARHKAIAREPLAEHADVAP